MHLSGLTRLGVGASGFGDRCAPNWIGGDEWLDHFVVGGCPRNRRVTPKELNVHHCQCNWRIMERPKTGTPQEFNIPINQELSSKSVPLSFKRQMYSSRKRSFG